MDRNEPILANIKQPREVDKSWRMRLEKRVNQNNNTIIFTWLFFTSLVIALYLMMNSSTLSHQQQMFEEFRERSSCQCFCKSDTLSFPKGLGVEEKEDIAIAGVTATLSLYNLVNHDSQVCNSPLFFVINSIHCSLMSESNGEISKLFCNLDKKESGEYEVNYLPISPGRYKLYIEVDNKNISGSPVALFVRQKVSKYPVKIISEVTSPQGITFNVRGEVAVAEYGGHCVSIFDPETDEKLQTFGTQGSDLGQFNHPCDVAINDDGNMLVVDGKNHRLQVFTSDKRPNTTVGRHGDNDQEFNFPVGIEIHPQTKRVYVAEGKNHRVQILTPELTFYKYLPGKFNEPKDVAFDSHGNVYVADNENHQIQVFSVEGELLRKFGEQGKKEGQMIYPTGISIDADDIVYVTELYNYRISLFTLKGKFLVSFGEKGKEPGQFLDPRGIAVDKKGKIYVSDHKNDRIQVFQ